MRIIYYYIVLNKDPSYIRKWSNSIRSLRKQNRSIAVWMFVFNGHDDALAKEALRWGVSIYYMGDYRAWLCRQHEKGGLLESNPSLGQLLVLADHRRTDSFSQALYLDCDTIVFDDPEILFESCSDLDFYAREIPGSSYCAGGPTDNVDDVVIEMILKEESLYKRIPFNTGVCMLNRRMLTLMPVLGYRLLDFAWRLMVGQQQFDLRELPIERSAERKAIRESTAATVRRLRTPVLTEASSHDLQRALKYPSDNGWILDEFAWLFTLGTIDKISQQTFSPFDVAQGEECINRLRERRLPIIGHYFSSNERTFLGELTHAMASHRRGSPMVEAT